MLMGIVFWRMPISQVRWFEVPDFKMFRACELYLGFQKFSFHKAEAWVFAIPDLIGVRPWCCGKRGFIYVHRACRGSVSGCDEARWSNQFQAAYSRVDEASEVRNNQVTSAGLQRDQG